MPVVFSPKIQMWISNRRTVPYLFSGSSKVLNREKYDLTEHWRSWSSEALETSSVLQRQKLCTFFLTRFITVQNCVNEEPQLIYHLILCSLFDCMLLPSEVFVVVVGLELNLNKLYGLWKFFCTDHQLTETTRYVQK